MYPAIYAFWREGSLEPDAEGTTENTSVSSTYLELGSIKNRIVAPVSQE